MPKVKIRFSPDQPLNPSQLILTEYEEKKILHLLVPGREQGSHMSLVLYIQKSAIMGHNKRCSFSGYYYAPGSYKVPVEGKYDFYRKIITLASPTNILRRFSHLAR